MVMVSGFRVMICLRVRVKVLTIYVHVCAGKRAGERANACADVLMNLLRDPFLFPSRSNHSKQDSNFYVHEEICKEIVLCLCLVKV